jgi:hypothetical protein
VNVTGIGAVSFNPQTLTVAQQMQAAANIAAVQYIPQSLTADNPPTGKGQASLARQNIYAAPFDAMAYNGLQVNGGCEIDQQFGGANGIAPNATNYYPADNWWLANSSGISINSGQYVMPAVGSFGFKTGIVVNNGATNTTLTGSAFLRLFNTIEGYRIRRLRWGTTEAQPVTISFAATAGSATTFSVTVSNIDGSRYYTDTFTIAVGNVFQWFTLTIPGCTDGTWNATNGIGFAVGFVISAGPSTAMAPAAVKTWQASPGNLIVAPGSSPANFFSTANAFYVTGLTVLPGLEAPSAARASLVMRPYDQELVACRRYWQSSYNLGTAPGTANQQTYILMQATGNGQTLVGNYVYSTPMRAMPTISIFGYAGGPNGWSDLGGVDRSAGSINSISTLGFSAGTANTALTVGQWYLTNFVANARL